VVNDGAGERFRVADETRNAIPRRSDVARAAYGAAIDGRHSPPTHNGRIVMIRKSILAVVAATALIGYASTASALIAMNGGGGNGRSHQGNSIQGKNLNGGGINGVESSGIVVLGVELPTAR